jgi:hypothetical protein
MIGGEGEMATAMPCAYHPQSSLMPLLPENWSPGLGANSQFTNKREQGFEEKRIEITCQMNRRTGRVNLSKHWRPPSERKCLLSRRSSGAQLDCVTKYMFTWPLALVLQVPGAVCLGWQVYCSGGQRER